jgi:hypothetical protein
VLEVVLSIVFEVPLGVRYGIEVHDGGILPLLEFELRGHVPLNRVEPRKKTASLSNHFT